jgi:phage internal scaffolding protein
MNISNKYTKNDQKNFSASRKRVQVEFLDPSLTQQQFKDECDINNILDLYGRTGQLPNANVIEGQYLDLSQLPSYVEAKNFIAKANEQFEALPAETRQKFNNDPAKFLTFCDDPKNAETLVKLGLAEITHKINEQAPDKEPVPSAGGGSKS